MRVAFAANVATVLLMTEMPRNDAELAHNPL
jgi:hypothetical protein